MVRVRTTGGVIVVDNDMWRCEASRPQCRFVVVDIVAVIAWHIIKVEITISYEDPEDNSYGDVAKRSVAGVNRYGNANEIRGPVATRECDARLVHVVNAGRSERQDDVPSSTAERDDG